MDTRKQDIIETLRSFVNQRPGLDFANYGDMKYYRQDYRGILQAKHDFEAMLGLIYSRDDITADDLISATSAFSGRLQIKELEDRKIEIDYCAGQYFPTEYRSAACAVLASAIWSNYRQETDHKTHKRIYETGPDIAKAARLRFGPSIQKRWFH